LETTELYIFTSLVFSMCIPSVLGLNAGAVMKIDSTCTLWQPSNLKWNWGLFFILSPCTVKLELIKNLIACNIQIIFV